MSRSRTSVLVGITAVVGLVAACGSADAGASSPAAVASPAATTASLATEGGPLRTRAGTMGPGDYQMTVFKPTLAFTLGDTWLGLSPDDPTGFGMELPGEQGMFAFTRLTNVVDPTTHQVVPVADDLIGWLLAHPSFDWSGGRTPVDVAGLKGEFVEGHVKGMGSSDFFAYDAGNMRIIGGSHMRIYVLPLDGRDLTIVVVGFENEANYDATWKAAQTILGSLRIVSP